VAKALSCLLPALLLAAPCSARAQTVPATLAMRPADLGQLLIHDYPPKAARARLEGDTRMECQASATGVLSGCTVFYETPAGFGFAEAAIRAAPHIRMTPATEAGRPVASTVRIPIQWRLAPLAAPAPGR
jgi:TonB family protein